MPSSREHPILFIGSFFLNAKISLQTASERYLAFKAQVIP